MAKTCTGKYSRSEQRTCDRNHLAVADPTSKRMGEDQWLNRTVLGAAVTSALGDLSCWSPPFAGHLLIASCRRGDRQ